MTHTVQTPDRTAPPSPVDTSAPQEPTGPCDEAGLCEAAPPNGAPHEVIPYGSSRPPLVRRCLRGIAIVVLVLGPTGYLAWSAVRSHDPAAARDERALLAGPVRGQPAFGQRHNYQVPVPPNATDVTHFETNSWKTSSLYVRFTTTPTGLARFLTGVNTTRHAMRDGEVTTRRPKRHVLVGSSLRGITGRA